MVKSPEEGTVTYKLNNVASATIHRAEDMRDTSFPSPSDDVLSLCRILIEMVSGTEVSYVTPLSSSTLWADTVSDSCVCIG